MKNQPSPRWAFNLYCFGRGDEYCASDPGLPISPPRRLFWRVRGWLLTNLFGWWRWV
jgi:hypothetical protein